LGDIILSTAAIRAIREKFRENYKISFLVGQESKEVLLRCPYIDELMVIDLKNKDKGLAGIFNFANILRKNDFDMVIDLQNNRKSHLLSFLTLSLNRYGYDNKKFSRLLNHRIKDNSPLLNPVAHQFRILSMLGIDLKDAQLELWPTEEDRQYVDELLSSQWLSANQKLIGLNISASDRWLTKAWPEKHIAKLCEELANRNLIAVLTGTQKDLEKSKELVNMVKNIKLIDACAKTTVNQLACLIKKCAVYISADSSPLHIASAVNTPVVALFGPTDPRRHMPTAKNSVMIRKELECSPCYKAKCKNNKCMDLITPEEVLEAVMNLLK
jgi:lipopolysaccharide heptosyltransferase II